MIIGTHAICVQSMGFPTLLHLEIYAPHPAFFLGTLSCSVRTSKYVEWCYSVRICVHCHILNRLVQLEFENVVGVCPSLKSPFWQENLIFTRD